MVEHNKQNEDQTQEKGEVFLTVEIDVSPDRLFARISGNLNLDWDRVKLQRHITGTLRDKGIKYGLDANAVLKAINTLLSKEPVENLVLAKGVPSTSGSDAQIETFVDFDNKRTGRTDDKGHVNFRDLGPMPVVEEGTLLARLTPAVKGSKGKDVFGKVIMPAEVRLLRLKASRGAMLSEDGNEVLAAVSGMPRKIDQETFGIQEHFVVDGNVDFNTGHIDYPGAVKVNGSILADFRVRCVSLEAEHLEPGSMVEVEDELTVYGGIMGAVVKAGGAVQARFIRDTKMMSGGNITVENEIVQSRLQAAGAVRVASSSGRIVNSYVAALKGVNTYGLSSSAKGATVIRIGIRPEFERSLTQGERQLEQLEEKKQSIIEEMQSAEDELHSTENELRSLLAMAKDTPVGQDRDNLVAQIKMIQPMRDALKQEIIDSLKKIDDITWEKQRLGDKLEEMRLLLPADASWVDVRGKAEPTTEIKGPRASLVLNNWLEGASFREYKEDCDEESCTTWHIRHTPVRKSAYKV